MAHKNQVIVFGFVCRKRHTTAHLAFYDALLTLFSFQGTTCTDALVSRAYHGRYALPETDAHGRASVTDVPWMVRFVRDRLLAP